jgi:hypothetical protein
MINKLPNYQLPKNGKTEPSTKAPSKATSKSNIKKIKAEE